MDQGQRLRLVAAQARLDVSGDVVPLPSHSNDAWRVGDSVLRICWRGDRTRLTREAALLERLPAEVPHPRLLGAGAADGHPWTLTRWVDGALLVDLWPSMDAAERDAAAGELASALRSLHEWEPDDDLRAAVAARPHPTTSDVIAGSDLNPLPLSRAVRLLAPAKRLRFVDPAVIDQLAVRLDELRDDDPLATSPGSVIHGDAHLSNVLWDGSRATLLDFEWARLGPPDLELQPLLTNEPGRPLDIVNRLVHAYPSLTARPDVVRRLWLYDLAQALRQLLVWPPAGPPEALPDFHPLRRIPQIVESPGYIERLLAP